MTAGRCRICDNAAGNTTLTAREMMFGMRDTFDYLVCAACGCIQIARAPDRMDRYYPPEYYSFTPPKREGAARALLQRCRASHLLARPNPIGWWVTRRYGVPPIINYLRRASIRRTHSVLDVGCGSGQLLLAMRSYGFTRLTGVDPFVERDLDYGNGVRVYRRDLDDYEGRHDIVMLHHSLEHMDAPRAVLTRIRALLNDGGTVLVRIPVASSEAFETYGADWVQLDAPRHLYLHTRASVDVLARQTGFAVAEVVYDSTAFQFWGSEQYRRDIPLHDPRSYLMDRSAFSRSEIAAFEARARRLNEAGRGDQACFYLEQRPA
jgi:SAM-dependent methyltransferase